MSADNYHAAVQDQDKKWYLIHCFMSSFEDGYDTDEDLRNYVNAVWLEFPYFNTVDELIKAHQGMEPCCEYGLRRIIYASNRDSE